MKPDLYTKAILTIIMLLLAVIACNQYVSPAATASAQGPFAGVQYAHSLEFFDSRTGDLWSYDRRGGELVVEWHSKFSKLGEKATIADFKH